MQIRFARFTLEADWRIKMQIAVRVGEQHAACANVLVPHRLGITQYRHCTDCMRGQPFTWQAV